MSANAGPIELYTMEVDGQAIRAFIQETASGILGCVHVPTPHGTMQFAAKVPIEAVRALLQRFRPQIEALLVAEANGNAEAGRQRRRFGSRLKKAFKGKVLGKLANAARKVLNSRVMRGVMKAANFIPGFGQAANAAYNVARKAADVASRLGQGRTSGVADVRALRCMAEGGCTPDGSPLTNEQIEIAGRTLKRVRRAFGSRYGSALQRIARQGAVTGSRDVAIVTGAVELYGSNSPARALSQRSMGRRDGASVAGIRNWVQSWFRRGYDPQSRLREAYALGLSSLANQAITAGLH